MDTDAQRRDYPQTDFYGFVSGKKVNVLFQQSRGGASWTTTATGTGEKIKSIK